MSRSGRFATIEATVACNVAALETSSSPATVTIGTPAGSYRVSISTSAV